MKVERVRSTVLTVTLHAYELSTLIAAARWACEGREGELSSEAVDQLKEVLASYDAEIRSLSSL